MPEEVDHLICYSDSCGGQNKNKNISKLFMYTVRATNLKTIEHKFFEPGHSYMECDRSFGLIEKNKKKIPQVFVPGHWTSVIKKSSKNFKVREMKNEDFLSFRFLNEQIMDPKKDEEKQIIKWRSIVWFKYDQQLLFRFLFKNVRNEEHPFEMSENCSKLKVGKPRFNLNKFSEVLYTSPIKISSLKYKNLMELLPFIPPVYHAYYKNMAHENDSGDKKKSVKGNKAEEETQAKEGEGEESFRILLESDYDD